MRGLDKLKKKYIEFITSYKSIKFRKYKVINNQVEIFEKFVLFTK